MHTHPEVLTTFLESFYSAVQGQAEQNSEYIHFIQKVKARLATSLHPATPNAKLQPSCSFLSQVVSLSQNLENHEHNQITTGVHPSVAEHALALEALSPKLAWWRRPDSKRVGEPFASGHANAVIIGGGGFEERDDVKIGVSLLAPGIEYPEHNHPPEEIYLVLSPGEWKQGNESWNTPGTGGLVHHQPNVMHTMRSHDQPLLATWCLISE